MSVTIIDLIVWFLFSAFIGVPVYFLFMCFINYLYEVSHFKFDENGNLELRHVWWGKYFGYKHEE